MLGTNTKNYFFPLVTLTTLFFMWGFITCLNDILIPYLKDVFLLNYFQSNLVQLAFFVAYFVLSLLYFIVSALVGDPILKIGYKHTIELGVIISAIACFLMFMETSSENPTFEFILGSLFLLGTGFAFLQIAANPLVAVLGTPESATSRLNFSQAFNSLGTTLAPIIGGYVIFNLLASDSEIAVVKDPSAVQIPYLFLASVLLLLAGIIFFADIPNVTPVSQDEELSRVGALKYPHLVFGMFAIFFYVGAEVAIGSNLISYMRELYHFPDQVASAFLSFYWGGAMIGRFMGTFSMGSMKSKKKYFWMLLVAVFSLFLIFVAFATSLNLTPQSVIEFFKGKHIYYFFIAVVLNYIVFVAARSLPSRTLGFCGVMNIILLSVMMYTKGDLSLWAILSVGLFNSIMFSNVFTLAIDGLGKYTSQGSSLLVMMILGGAVMPPIQGFLLDQIQEPKFAFALPLICYVYLVWYGFKGCRIRRNKNIN